MLLSGVKGLTKLEECFEDGKFQTVLPSEEKARQSLRVAHENLYEAQGAARGELFRAATNSIYVAIFHAARAVLFRDGIREKSHFCLELVSEYLCGIRETGIEMDRLLCQSAEQAGHQPVRFRTPGDQGRARCIHSIGRTVSRSNGDAPDCRVK